MSIVQNKKAFHDYFIEEKYEAGIVLEGYWIFTKINEDACSIEFHLHYEFSNFILDKLISPIFSQIANTFVDGFVSQADKIYTK